MHLIYPNRSGVSIMFIMAQKLDEDSGQKTFFVINNLEIYTWSGEQKKKSFSIDFHSTNTMIILLMNSHEWYYFLAEKEENEDDLEQESLSSLWLLI